MEGGVAEGEDAPVGGHQPVATTVGSGSHADHRLVEGETIGGAEERRPAEGTDPTVATGDPVARSPRGTAIATAGLVNALVVANQSDLSPTVAANPSPVRATLWFDPTSVIVVTLPPRSPYPLRPVIVMDCSVPSCGQSASMVDTGTDAVQVWFGLQAPGTQTESPASTTAGKLPGLV